MYLAVYLFPRPDLNMYHALATIATEGGNVTVEFGPQDAVRQI